MLAAMLPGKPLSFKSPSHHVLQEGFLVLRRVQALSCNISNPLHLKQKLNQINETIQCEVIRVDDAVICFFQMYLREQMDNILIMENR